MRFLWVSLLSGRGPAGTHAVSLQCSFPTMQFPVGFGLGRAHFGSPTGSGIAKAVFFDGPSKCGTPVDLVIRPRQCEHDFGFHSSFTATPGPKPAPEARPGDRKLQFYLRAKLGCRVSGKVRPLIWWIWGDLRPPGAVGIDIRTDSTLIRG